MLTHVINIKQEGDSIVIKAHRVKEGFVTRAELDYSNKVALFVDKYNEKMRERGNSMRAIEDIVGDAVEKHASKGSKDPIIPLED